MLTEHISPRFVDLDSWSTSDMIEAMYDGQLTACAAVRPALPAINAAVDKAVLALKRGGRLVYVGAGTSGRIAVQDGAELGPTYDWPSDRTVFVMAGGMQAVVVGAVNLLFTLVAMTLIDRLGRKTLLVIGSAGMTIALSGIAMIFITGRWHAALIFFVAGFIASFATSSGAVIWVYMSEIFPTSVRVKGQALGSTVLWVMNGLISQIFPLLSAKSASLPFVCFAVVMALQFVVTLLYFPETKGLSLEDLQQKLRLNET